MFLIARGLLRSATRLQRCENSTLLALCRHNNVASNPQPRRLSTSALGTLYEEHCLRTLQSLLPGQVHLQKIGGRGDRGIDLTGWWTVPVRPDSADHIIPQRIRVFVQCKSTLSKTKKLGPVALREMEGVLGRYRTRLGVAEPSQGVAYEEDAVSTPLMAVICSSSGFSKATNTQVSALDGVNFLLVHLPLPSDVQEMAKSEGEEGSGSEDGIEADGRGTEVQDTPPDYPTTVLCSPSLTNNHANRLGGYFDLRWERAIPEARRHAEEDFGASQQEDDEGPGVGLRPVLLWRHHH